jgi:ribosomal protein S18 acetylase RimI-like enzyme
MPSIEYRETLDVDLGALRQLRAACDFADKDDEYLAQQVKGARWVVQAYDGARLVGFCRAISDGVSNAYVSSVMVAPGYRRRGIGREMLARLLAGREEIRFVLHTRPESAAFYAAVGFTVSTDVMTRDRRR